MRDQGFRAGGPNIHYLEKRLAERKNKAIALT
jgi:acetyl-CoA carboxylase biotin carboxylase subunit